MFAVMYLVVQGALLLEQRKELEEQGQTHKAAIKTLGDKLTAQQADHDLQSVEQGR